MKHNQIEHSKHTYLCNEVNLSLPDLVDTAESAYAAAHREAERSLEKIARLHIDNGRAFIPGSRDPEKCYQISMSIAHEIERAQKHLADMQSTLATCAALYLAALDNSQITISKEGV